MKILMINHFPLAGSGSGTYTRNLAVQLAAAGHEVTVVLPENTADYEPLEGVKLHPVFFTPESGESDAGAIAGTGGTAGTGDCPKGRSMDDALPFNFPCFTTHPRSTVAFDDLSPDEFEMYKDAFRAAIKDEIKNNRPDIIHGQHVWVLPDLATGYGIPIVLTAHGTDLMGYDKWPEMRKYADHVISEASRVISISQDNLDLLNSMFPDQKEKFVRKRNGYDPGVFYADDLNREEVLSGFGITHDDLCAEAPSEDGTKAGAATERKVVCFAGKLTDFKGVDVLLDAVKLIEAGPGNDEKIDGKIAGKDDEIIDEKNAAGAVPLFIIVGDGERREALKAQAEELGLQSVRFLGNVDQKTLRAIYNVSDMDVVPSRREPFGLVAIEAMACGIPVVASNQGGLPDFVNDSVGALAEPENAEDLAEKILEVLGRTGAEGWRSEIAAYARENYAQDRIIKELEDLYDEVVSEGPARQG